MAITVKQLPNTYALVENGLLCRVERSVFLPLDQEADYSIVIPNTLEGETTLFILSLMGQSIQFDFVAEPNDSGKQLTKWVTGVSRAVFVNNMMIEMARNFWLAKYYDLSTIFEFSAIRIKAKAPGPAYNITYSSPFTGLNFVVGYNGVLSQIPAGFRIYMAMQSGSDIIADELVPLNEHLIAAADFKIYIKDLLKTDFTFPFSPPGKIRVLPDSVMPLTLVYAEKHEATGIHRFHYSDEFFAVPGGLSQNDKDLLELIGSDYFEGLDAAARFLSWCPPNKKTAWGVPERLFLLNVDKDGTDMMLKIYYLDGTTEEEEIGTIYDQIKIYEIISGLHELRPDIDPELVEKYEIWGQENFDQITEKRTFVMDQLPRYKRRGFIFKNSFDVYETLMCTGELSVSDSLSRDIMEVVDGRAYRLKINTTENLAKFKCHTGWLDGLANRRWLEDFLRSKQVYWIVGDALFPIILTTGEVERERDKEFLHGLAFEFTLDVREERYSAIINEGLHYLRDEDFVIVQDEDGIKLEGF